MPLPSPCRHCFSGDPRPPLPAMRIVCPSCSAEYEVPESRVTVGRTVRCARCGSDWVPVTATPSATADAETPPKAEVPLGVPAPPELEAFAPLEPARADNNEARRSLVTVSRSAMARLAAHPALPRSSTALRLAWAGTIVLLLVLLAGAFAWRSQIVAAWPPSARAYAVLGFHP
jgi:predicted Zn finger-like uncharacterized protein